MILHGHEISNHFYLEHQQGCALLIFTQLPDFVHDETFNSLILSVVDKTIYHYVFTKESYDMCLYEHLVLLNDYPIWSNSWYPNWIQYIKNNNEDEDNNKQLDQHFDNLCTTYPFLSQYIMNIQEQLRNNTFALQKQQPNNYLLIYFHSKPDDDYYELYWAIENKDLFKLESICSTIKRKCISIKLYWPILELTEIERKRSKCYICGILDFSPLQHAKYIQFNDGYDYLVANKIGIACGLGLGS
jgi:hypothetical protein